MSSTKVRLYGLVFSIFMVAPAWGGADLLESRLMSLELARDVAQKALDTCRNMGYQVSVVVVDRSGYPQVVLRDVYASRFTAQIAEEKANAVILSGISSGEFRENRSDVRDEMNHVEGVLLLRGAIPLRSGGYLVGALGVSGAPGADKDEACANKALESVRERLEFAD